MLFARKTRTEDLDNYRGFTISFFLGKIFEHIILNRMLTKLDNQSNQQYGFTCGLSPAMATVLATDTELEMKSKNKTLTLALLHTKSL